MRYTKNTRGKLQIPGVVLFLSISLLFCSFSFRVFAQERKSHIIPGRVMVKFIYDEITLPKGESKADIGRVNVRSATLQIEVGPEPVKTSHLLTRQPIG